MSQTQKTGFIGQDRAHDFLISRGYRFVEQNYHARAGEIDLIFMDEDQYVFVEVKTRSSEEFGLPEDALTDSKKEKLRNTGLAYLVNRNINTDNFRFDAVAIILNDLEDDVIRHHINIME